LRARSNALQSRNLAGEHATANASSAMVNLKLLASHTLAYCLDDVAIASVKRSMADRRSGSESESRPTLAARVVDTMMSPAY
jgi:hypothetical protein